VIDEVLAHLRDVAGCPVACGLLCCGARTVIRALAWRNVLAAAYPERSVRLRDVLGACAAGVGLNAIAPANGGDVLRLRLMRKRIAGASYPTLASTLLVGQIVDLAVIAGLTVWALESGLLPAAALAHTVGAVGVPFLGGVARYVLAAAALIAGALGIRLMAGRLAELWRRVAQGLAVLRTPVAYLRGVAFPQLLDWALRLAVTYCFLRAFHLPATLDNVLRLQVAQILATLVPVLPGGVGVSQALAIYALGGQATRAAVLGYSVGSEALSASWSLVLGAIALSLMLGTLRWRGPGEDESRAPIADAERAHPPTAIRDATALLARSSSWPA